MKLTKNSKIILVVVVILAVLFLLLNAAWAVHYKSFDRYDTSDYTQPFGSSYVKSAADGYHYNVKYPDYLSFSGNLGITNGADTLSLIFWPELFGSDEYEIGVILFDADGTQYMFYVDENLNLLPKKNNLPEETVLVIEELMAFRESEIKHAYSSAKQEWNI